MMKLIWLPIVFSVGVIVIGNRDKIIDQYRAAYPADPVKRAAIEQCALSRYFNRLDPDDREGCYAAVLGHALAGLTPAPAPVPVFYDADSPSHLPEADVRRREAYDRYEAGQTAPPPIVVGAAHAVHRTAAHPVESQLR